jgi:hypothetical protein
MAGLYVYDLWKESMELSALNFTVIRTKNISTGHIRTKFRWKVGTKSVAWKHVLTLHFRNHNCSIFQTSRISIQLVCDISHSIKINLHIIKQHVSISGKNIYHSIPLLCYWSVILITTIRFKFYAECRNFPPLFRAYHYQHLGKVKHTHWYNA